MGMGMGGSSADPSTLPFLAGGGEMGARMRAFDWSTTPLGAPAGWPASLKAAVGICLSSRYPIVIWWGREALTSFYNDGYIPMLGVTKHPGWLGRSGRECWSEIWSVISPMFDCVFATGEATWAEDFLLVLDRNLPREENYFTFSYSPIRDDAGQVGGVFCAVTETTARVIGERRLRTLRDLGRAVTTAKEPGEACRTAAETLAENLADLPFAAIYLLDGEGRHAELFATTGLMAKSRAAPQRIELGENTNHAATWPLKSVFASGTAELVSDLSQRFGALPSGPWPEPCESALVLPIAAPGQARPTGFLVVGLSPRRVLDADYRGFCELIAGHLGTAVANARAYAEEKRRAEALAAIDRAKTTFFSNVSHEFRTPLSLMLGPIEDLLDRDRQTLSPSAISQLEVVNRNGKRLLRLVNTLLDFSRIEAGRVRACYLPTDLSELTVDLGSVFRSACERAGLGLFVSCEALGEPVYVDRDMWEKVILNLVSNAFKFTFEGEIAVTLRRAGKFAELTVRDTGTGIAAEDIPRLFERFHRVPNARGRTHEGTGIGLALVQELVRLHGGTIAVKSELGKGTAFTLAIPFGTAHLPPDQIGQIGQLGAGRAPLQKSPSTSPYVEEALRWLPDEKRPTDLPPATDSADGLSSPFISLPRVLSERSRVLVADDNADMRQYIVRLLETRYRVEAVPDGEAALAAVRRERPELILTDVMMPRLDGFGLVRELRADPELADLPIIMLSARAGEESRVEGLSAGSDDYLVKPFGARELFARVTALLEISRMRREANRTLRESEERFRALVNASSDVVYRMSPDWTEMRYLHGREFIIDTYEPSRTWLQTYIHPDDQGHVMAVISDAIRNKSVVELEHRVLRKGGSFGWTFSRAVPMLDEAGEIMEWFGAASDITARREAEEALRQADRRKDEFLATLAHELRNPLAPLRSGLEIMRLTHDRASVERARAMMERQLEQMVHLVNDLLDLSRISRGKIELKKERVELATIVKQAVETTHPAIAQAGHALKIVLPPSPVYVDADATRLSQVFSNLLHNAIKYTEPDGEIRLEVTERDGEALVSVKDNGIGIPKRELSKVFDMFTQVDRNLERSHSGLGIGLSIVKRLVEMHGGTVEARSDGAGRGSEFIVRLPVTPAVRPVVSAKKEPLRASQFRVLVVDDNEDGAASLAMMLELMGHQVMMANDGFVALELLPQCQPDLILLDIGMPKMNGYETARKVRVQPWGKDAVLVALTGWGQAEDRRKSQEAGFDSHMVKPIAVDALKKLLAGLPRRSTP